MRHLGVLALAGLIAAGGCGKSAEEKKEEKQAEQAAKNIGKAPVGFTVGFDALAVYVHKDNPLNEITFEQLTQIFAEGGKTTRWSEIGVKIPGVKDDTIVRDLLRPRRILLGRPPAPHKQQH